MVLERSHTKIATLTALLLLSVTSFCMAEELFDRYLIFDPIQFSNWFNPKSSQLRVPLTNLSRIAAGYLFVDDSESKWNMESPVDIKLAEILKRDGPDVRSSRDNRNFDDVSIPVAKRAWTLLQQHASRAIRLRVEMTRNAIEQTLINSHASPQCLNSTRQVFEGAKRLDSWALQIINSWGSFPMSGLFEGTYTDLGSFHVCTNVPKNNHINHAHYCTITFRPVMPSQKHYELVTRKLAPEFLQIFNRSDKLGLKDAFADLIEHSQYFRFLYYKIGTCWPIGCSPFDVRRVVKYVSQANILSNGPVKCYSNFADDYEEEGSVDFDMKDQKKIKLKISTGDANNGLFIWKPYFTRAQLIASIIVGAIIAFLVMATLVDFLFNRVSSLVLNIKQIMQDRLEPNTANFRPHLQDPKESSPICDNNDEQTVQSLIEEAETKVKSDDVMEPTIVLKTDKVSSGTIDPYCEVSENKESTELVELPVRDTVRAKITELSTFSDSGNKLSFRKLASDCSIITNTAQFFQISSSQLKNDILCLNGIRCITMFWIIITHTMLYNDWGGFARTREIEKALDSILTQPVFNATHLVDTFFLMSGLLTAFTVFKSCKNQKAKFNWRNFIMNRWLRLTPQLMIISVIYIVLPLANSGPHWYSMTGEYSENCSKNWWINMLHIQAFHDQKNMCNFPTWWVSMDSYYHLYALSVILIILFAGHQVGFLAIVALVASHMSWQAYRHYQLSLPPNVFSTIPQTGLMWSEFTLEFFWTPYSHIVPFFMGFYLGYLMAAKRELLLSLMNLRRAFFGWIMASLAFVIQAYSTYWWVTGRADYSRIVATIFHVFSPIVWSMCFCWLIMACHHGYGGFINDFLSARPFIILGKASYLIYLSHFQVVFYVLGSQNLLLEPSPLSMGYLLLGNMIFSAIYGIITCILFELPWLKIHRRIIGRI